MIGSVTGRAPLSSPALARQPQTNLGEPEIGEGTVIGCHVVIYLGVKIGRDCLIGDGANIREGTTIGDRCVIGRHACVSYDCSIGDDVRIQDQANIVGGTRIGSGTFIGIGVTMCNDRRIDPANYRFTEADPPLIGERVMIGTGAVLLAGVKIGDGAVVGAGALVVNDVMPGERVLSPKAVAR